LEDLRSYRERLVAAAGLRAVFPLWQRDPLELASAFIDGGFSALTVCVDALALPKSFAGRTFDRAFLAELPPKVDPCGENGEFHTFVSAGPHFKRPVVYCKGKVGERRERYSAEVASYFYTCELFAC
jgi:diphthamide synthase (EF-2-diphthine--ammonia ligase)